MDGQKGELPKGWKKGKLGEVCSFVRGPFGGSLKKDIFVEKGYAVYEQRHAIYDDFTEIRYYIGEEKFLEMKRFELLPGDIIMSCSGTMGKVAVVPKGIQRGIINQALLKLSVRNNLSNRYLEMWLQSPHFQDSIDEYSKGAAIKNVASVKILQDIPIPLPPLPTQRAIVARLDAAFARIDQARANLERNIENARELFQAKLNEVFSRRGDGWEEKTLIDVASYFGRGKSKHRPRNDKNLYGGDYPFVQTGDVRNAQKYITEYTQTYNEMGLSQSKLWQKGTVCITIAANIAEVGILDFDACFPDSIIGLVVNSKKTTPEYCYYSLLFLQSVLKAKGKGSAQDNINLGTFETQLFPFPALKKQKEIISILNKVQDELENLEASYAAQLQNLTHLKQSLLQKAFSGQLIEEAEAVSA